MRSNGIFKQDAIIGSFNKQSKGNYDRNNKVQTLAEQFEAAKTPVQKLERPDIKRHEFIPSSPHFYGRN